MYRIMCTSKIHRAVITQCELDYVGSITLDLDLMEAADILPGERVDVVNVNNGARFQTYVFTGKRGSGTVCLNGPAARLGQVGDKVIVLTYRIMDDREAKATKMRVIHVDKDNKIIPA